MSHFQTATPEQIPSSRLIWLTYYYEWWKPAPGDTVKTAVVANPGESISEQRVGRVSESVTRHLEYA